MLALQREDMAPNHVTSPTGSVIFYSFCNFCTFPLLDQCFLLCFFSVYLIKSISTVNYGVIISYSCYSCPAFSPVYYKLVFTAYLNTRFKNCTTSCSLTKNWGCTRHKYIAGLSFQSYLEWNTSLLPTVFFKGS